MTIEKIKNKIEAILILFKEWVPEGNKEFLNEFLQMIFLSFIFNKISFLL